MIDMRICASGDGQGRGEGGMRECVLFGSELLPWELKLGCAGWGIGNWKTGWLVGGREFIILRVCIYLGLYIFRYLGR